MKVIEMHYKDGHFSATVEDEYSKRINTIECKCDKFSAEAIFDSINEYELSIREPKYFYQKPQRCLIKLDVLANMDTYFTIKSKKTRKSL